MDRREMLAGAAMLPSFLLTREQVLRGIGAFVSPEAEAHFRSLPPPYDPVAVLEAMRAAGFEAQLCIQQNPGGSLWESVWLERPTRMDYNRETFPDFPSAVRWLHEQAAAADPAFAEQWPVPDDGLTNEQLDAVAEHLRATGQAKG